MFCRSYKIAMAILCCTGTSAYSDALHNSYNIKFPAGTNVCEYPDHDALEAYRQAHVDCSATSGGLFESSPESIILHFDHSRKKTLTSELAACAGENVDNCIRYEVIAFNRERNFLILLVGGYEEGTFYLYDMRFGVSFDLQSPPIFSQSGDELVVINANDMGPRDHEVMVFSIGEQPFRQTYVYNQPKYETWAFVDWSNKDIIKLTRDQKPYSLVRNGASWIFPNMAPLKKH